jgi:CRP-like cAMP-binding protein
LPVAFIEHGHLRDLCHAHPRLADAFWRETLLAGAISRTWVLNIGGRAAYARMAHLLCEMWTRLRAVDLARGEACELPITQAEFGEALGISTVHVNRVLKALRADSLISLERGSLVVDDWAGLRRAGEFDPAYLHLPWARPRAA